MFRIVVFKNKSFFNVVLSKKKKINDYKSLIKIIFQLQKIKIKKKYKLGKFNFKLPVYTLKSLHKESDLFFDWYLKYTLKKGNLYFVLFSSLKKINVLFEIFFGT